MSLDDDADSMIESLAGQQHERLTQLLNEYDGAVMVITPLAVEFAITARRRHIRAHNPGVPIFGKRGWYVTSVGVWVFRDGSWTWAKRLALPYNDSDGRSNGLNISGSAQAVRRYIVRYLEMYLPRHDIRSLDLVHDETEIRNRFVATLAELSRAGGNRS